MPALRQPAPNPSAIPRRSLHRPGPPRRWERYQSPACGTWVSPGAVDSVPPSTQRTPVPPCAASKNGASTGPATASTSPDASAANASSAGSSTISTSKASASNSARRSASRTGAAASPHWVTATRSRAVSANGCGSGNPAAHRATVREASRSAASVRAADPQPSPTSSGSCGPGSDVATSPVSASPSPSPSPPSVPRSYAAAAAASTTTAASAQRTVRPVDERTGEPAGSGRDGGERVAHEPVQPGLEAVASQQRAGDHGGAPLLEHVGEAVQRLAGDDGHRPDPPRPARAVAEQHQPIDPGAHEHDVGGRQVLQPDVGDRVDRHLDPLARHRLADEAGRPGRLAGQALVDDHRSHGGSVWQSRPPSLREKRRPGRSGRGRAKTRRNLSGPAPQAP